MTVPNFHTKPNSRLEIITPDGISYDLHVPPKRVVWNMSGWGLSPRSRSTTRGPFQQGVTVMSQSLDPRTVTLTLRHNGCSFSGWRGNRTTYVDYFRENRSLLYNPDPIQLIYHYIEDGVYKSRALDVFFEDGFAFSPPNQGAWDMFSIQEELSFYAADPLVYDPTATTYTPASFTEQLTLPLAFPFVLNAWKSSAVVTYTGTWETFPTITVDGPIKNFSIINETTDKEINYIGEIVEGNPVTFDLSYGIKSVTDACGASLLGNVTGDLGVFSLQCDPIVTDGENTITVVAEGYDPGTTSIVLTYYTRYRGI